jgi:FkbM family methyltransferase
LSTTKLIIGEVLNLESKPVRSMDLRRIYLEAAIDIRPPYNFNGYRVNAIKGFHIYNLYKELFEDNVYNIGKNLNTVIDAGANIGMFSLKVKHHNPKCNIIGFEPVPSTYQYLIENTSKLSNCKYYNLALYSHNKGITISNDSCSGGNSVNAKDNLIYVKTDLLSNYIHNDIDLVKLDVEGSEYNILQDLEDNDKFKFIKNMAIEFHDLEKHNIFYWLNKLSDKGYNIKQTQLSGNYEVVVYICSKK